MMTPLTRSNRLITATVGTTMLFFGASQLVRPRRWISYMPASVAELLPVSPIIGLRIHGATNLSLGLLLLRRPSKPIAGLAALWWLGVLPMCAKREGWQTGLRDICIAASLIAVVASRGEKRIIADTEI